MKETNRFICIAIVTVFFGFEKYEDENFSIYFPVSEVWYFSCYRFSPLFGDTMYFITEVQGFYRYFTRV